MEALKSLERSVEKLKEATEKALKERQAIIASPAELALYASLDKDLPGERAARIAEALPDLEAGIREIRIVWEQLKARHAPQTDATSTRGTAGEKSNSGDNLSYRRTGQIR